MCIRDRPGTGSGDRAAHAGRGTGVARTTLAQIQRDRAPAPVSYTHLRAHETVLDLVCRLLLEKKKKTILDDIST